MLAYVFWHRPQPDAEVGDYEDAQRSFHAVLGIASASFRVAELPFEQGPGYEDWYLVEDWHGLGELNEAAVDRLRAASHDQAAAMSVDGWGGVYARVRGPAAIPEGIAWLSKPRGEPTEEFIASLTDTTVWQRQMVLGPAPEFCAGAATSPGRQMIWPDR